MTPSIVLLIMASSEESTIAASKSPARRASVRSETSRRGICQLGCLSASIGYQAFNRRKQISCQIGLVNIAARIYFCDLTGDHCEIILADDNNFGFGHFSPDDFSCLDSIHSGHGYVHEHNVRSQALRLLHRLKAV